MTKEESFEKAYNEIIKGKHSITLKMLKDLHDAGFDNATIPPEPPKSEDDDRYCGAV